MADKMRAQVIGAGDGTPWAAVITAVTAATTWISQNGGQVMQWAQSVTGTVAGWAESIAGFIGLGPSYDSANGGEVQRQLELTTPVMAGTGTGNAYCQWLRDYHPYTWETGHIWEANEANFSAWRGKYLQLMAAGLPEGALVDRNMVPIGLAQAQLAIAQADASGATDNTAPNPNWNTGFTPFTPRTGRVTPDQAGTGINPLLIGAGVGLFLLTQKNTR